MGIVRWNKMWRTKKAIKWWISSSHLSSKASKHSGYVTFNKEQTTTTHYTQLDNNYDQDIFIFFPFWWFHYWLGKVYFFSNYHYTFNQYLKFQPPKPIIILFVYHPLRIVQSNSHPFTHFFSASFCSSRFQSYQNPTFGSIYFSPFRFLVDATSNYGTSYFSII